MSKSKKYLFLSTKIMTINILITSVDTYTMGSYVLYLSRTLKSSEGKDKHKTMDSLYLVVSQKIELWKAKLWEKLGFECWVITKC